MGVTWLKFKCTFTSQYSTLQALEWHLEGPSHSGRSWAPEKLLQPATSLPKFQRIPGARVQEKHTGQNGRCHRGLG